MSVVHLQLKSGIEGARACALTLTDFAAEVRRQATHALIGVRKARTVEKIILRYGRVLRTYHAGQIAFHLAWRQIEGVSLQLTHRPAISIIKTAIAEIQTIIVGPHPWLSLPHLELTRRSAEKALLQVIASTQAVIDAAAVLNGERSKEASLS